MVVNILAPSMLSIDFGHMEAELKKAIAGGTDTIHVDVMDGMFVPNISFGPPVISYVKKSVPDAKLDVHMMVTDPIRYLDSMVKAGASGVTIHYEATKTPAEDLKKIREAGMKVGLSICPDTPVSAIEELLPLVDMVLVMSVYPGFGGQSFMEEAYSRIAEVRRLSDEKGLDLDIEVDGGINLENVKSVLDAGANVIVAGSAVFGESTEENVRKFLEIMT